MNKIKTISQYSLAALFIVAIGNADAEGEILITQLSFGTAINLALASDADIGIEQKKFQISKARVDEAKGAFYPSLNVFGTNQWVKAYDVFSGVTTTAQYNGATIPITVSKYTPRYQLNYGIELGYNLYSGGADQARVEEMSALEQASRAQLDVAKKRIIIEVAELYWGQRKAQIISRMTQRNLDYAKEQLVIARSQWEQGQISKIDFDAINIVVETSTLELHRSVRSIQEFQRRYYGLVGIDNSRVNEYKKVEEKATDIDVDKLVADFELLERPSVLRMQANYSAAQSRIKQVNAGYYPSIDIYCRNAYVGRSDSDIGTAQSNVVRDATTIGVRFNWNLFDGFRSDSRAVQANVASEQLRFEAEKARSDLDNRQQEHLAQEEDVRDELLLNKKKLDYVQSKLQIALRRFESQHISKLELHAAKLELDNATSLVENLEIEMLIQNIKNKFNWKVKT